MDHRMIAKAFSAIQQRPASGLSRLAGRFRRDSAAALAILVALLLPMVIGMMGLTVDVGIWYSQKRGLQDTVDAASLAGGGELANGSTMTAIITAATADATRNDFNPATDVITVNVPPTSGPNAGNDGSVEVIIIREMPLFFTAAFFKLIGASTQQFNATARAVVNTVFVDEFCILGLDPTAAKAVSVQGTGSATLDCGIAVNSDASNALNVGGSGSITATSVSTVGGIDVSSNGTFDIDEPPRRGQMIADPYSDLAIPTFSGCDAGGSKAYSVKNVETLDAGGDVFVICGGLDVGSGAELTLEPGTYIIDQGDFKINGGGAVIGEDVTIILTSSGGGSKIGNVAINGGADIEISAPSEDQTGAPGYSGVLFFQDRNVTSSPAKSNFINGGAEVDLQGALYFPNQDLDFSGGAEFGEGCTQLIAKKVTISGNAGVQGNCDTAGTRAVGRLRVSLAE